jgi:hypothetical protein
VLLGIGGIAVAGGAVLAVVLGRGGGDGHPSPPSPPATLISVALLDPGAGEVVEGTVKATVAVRNFQLNGATVGLPNRPGQGYLRFVMDGGRYDAPRYSRADPALVAKTGARGHFSPAVLPTLRYVGLPAGRHTLAVYAVNNDGTAAGPRSTVSFQVAVPVGTYRRRANAICAEAGRKISFLGSRVDLLGPNQTRADALTAAGLLMSVERGSARAFAALVPPPSVAALHARARALATTEVAYLEQFIAAVRDGEPVAAAQQAYKARFDGADGRLTSMYEGLGLTVCAGDSSPGTGAEGSRS